WTALVHSAPNEKVPADSQNAGTNGAPKSTYSVPSPTDPTEGRDPFFPNSRRRIKVVDVKTPTAPTADIVYIAFSGTPDHRLATITINGNGRTYAEGEQGEILSKGRRLEVRCVKITEENVVLEVNGERREIPFRGAK